jgi:hypothetical protein
LVCAILGSVAGQNSRTFPGFNSFQNDIQEPTISTTPIPILKYIDQHNTDGTYTYGYQSADGTYKIETRFIDGQVKGKYGYVDSNGDFKETSYGSGAEVGFVPVIDGVRHAPSQEAEAELELVNLVEQPTPVRAPVNRPAARSRTDLPAGRFRNFQPKSVEKDDVKMINGRRAILRKRQRTDAKSSNNVLEQPSRKQPSREQPVQEQQTFDNQELSRVEQLEARQQGLRVLEQQRAALIKLQHQQQQPSRSAARADSSRVLNTFQPQQETFRSFDPYVSGVNLDSGSYTINY